MPSVAANAVAVPTPMVAAMTIGEHDGALHAPTTAKLNLRMPVAETLVPKFVTDAAIDAEQVVVQLPMTPLPLPSETFDAPTSVIETVSPEQASGIEPMSTPVTLPALSTVATRRERRDAAG